jgi:hypothetical protein
MGSQNNSKTNLNLPDRITLEWLFRHVPVSYWVTLGAIIVGAFTLGVTLGQTTFVKELLGKKDESAQPKATIKTEETPAPTIASIVATPSPTPDKPLPPLSLTVRVKGPKESAERFLNSFREAKGLRKLAPLETGKTASSTPSRTFFFVNSFEFSKLDKGPDRIDDANVLNEGDPTYDFEIQKLSEDEIDVIAYVSEDAAGAVSRLDGKSQHSLVLFPGPWGTNQTLVSIPISRFVSAEHRSINTPEGDRIYVVDAVIR